MRRRIRRYIRRARRVHSNLKYLTYRVKRRLVSKKNKILPPQYSYPHSQTGNSISHFAGRVKTFNLDRKHTIGLALSILFAYFLLKSSVLSPVIPYLAGFGYISVFVLGILFPLGFTTAPVSAVLYSMSRHFNPFFMALVASLGAMIGNLLIYFFVKTRLTDEIRHICTNDLKFDFYKFELRLTRKRLKSKYFRVLVPVFSGLLISLPIPTEMFVSILWNINRVKIKYVLLLSFIFSFIGLLALALFGAH